MPSPTQDHDGNSSRKASDSTAQVQRLAHLPMLLKKMKSKAKLREMEVEDPEFSDAEDLRLTKSARAKDFPTPHRDISKAALISKPSTAISQQSGYSSTSGTSSQKKKKAETAKDQLHKKQESATDKDAFFEHAIHLETLMEEAAATDDDASSLSSGDHDGNDGFELDEEDGVSNETTNLLGFGGKKLNRKSFWYRVRLHWRRFKALLRPQVVKDSLLQFLMREFLLGMVPLLVMAWILFYVLGNPDLEFLPNTATLAWYLIFLVRLQVTFGLARLSQFLILDLLTIRTSTLAQWTGPLVALMTMQSNGFPFLLTSWGMWNLLLLHGHHSFCKHWLNFTGIAIFTKEYNPDGDGILQSDTYGRILFALVFVGVASAVKRTTVALFLSRRMLSNYKPQMEDIMNKVVLIAGVAELAAEVEKPGFAELLADAENSVATATQVQMERKSDYMNSVPTFEPSRQDIDSNSERSTGDYSIPDHVKDDDDGSGQWQKLKTEFLLQQAGGDEYSTTDTLSPRSSRSAAVDEVYDSLDRYDAPTTNASKRETPSLHDILQFRKATFFLDNGYPFTPAFGLVKTRKGLVRSAIKVFRRLQQFDPAPKQQKDDEEDSDSSDTLCFDVIGALAYNENGSFNQRRAEGLLQLFHPDNNENQNISLKAFVDSCDNVHKSMVFLKASMMNSSKIDSVLEDGFNVVFYGVLAVIILSLIGFNPWPLLVSFGTMLLSLAFALGPSCAKTVEGILAIAVRRPFDLGDRISLTTGLSESTPGLGETWIVEDINLMTTTLRYAATNEVSTISNSSLTGARIVNCARSQNAIVRLPMVFRLTASHEALAQFREELEKYLQSRPRVWGNQGRPIQFITTEINRNEHDGDDGWMVYRIGAQHVSSWQNLGPIVQHRGELEKECDRIAQELDIHFVSSAKKLRIEGGIPAARSKGSGTN